MFYTYKRDQQESINNLKDFIRSERIAKGYKGRFEIIKEEGWADFLNRLITTVNPR